MAELKWRNDSDGKTKTVETVIGTFRVIQYNPGRYRVQMPDNTYLDGVYRTMNSACGAVQGIHTYLTHHAS